MIKTCYLLSLVFLTGICFAQQKDASYGVAITQIKISDNDADTSRLLYVQNFTGDRLSAYLVRGGVISEATAYRLGEANQSVFFYNKSLLSNLLKNDSLRIDFQDKTHTVVINRTDRYLLFPAYYVELKREVKVKHSIIAVLNLLSDAIGDYPIAAALPLLSYTPQLTQQIRQATIMTQRSQADMKDIWTCHYFYNHINQLDSILARSPEETRFHKKVRYSSSGIRISTYQNIESRQTSNRSITYNKKDLSLIESEENFYETGKNRETISSATLRRQNLGMLKKIDPSTSEVLKLLKPIEKQK